VEREKKEEDDEEVETGTDKRAAPGL